MSLVRIRACLILVASLWGGEIFAAPGEVTSQMEINDVTGGLLGPLANIDFFGSATATLGDMDSDGIPDLAVGVPGDDDGGSGRGAVLVLFLNADGSVKGEQKISDTAGGFTGVLADQDQFGQAIASLGDIDGDTVMDIAVGAHLDDDGGAGRGAVWILFLNANGTVKAHQKISSTAGGFAGSLDDDDAFGVSVAGLGDVDGDTVGDLAVGAHQDDDGGAGRGAVWVLFLNTNGTVKGQQKVSDTAGGFAGALDDGDLFGVSLAGLADRNGDGVPELAVGADQDDDGGLERGAVWLLFLNATGTVFHEQKISSLVGGFVGPLADGDLFGRSVSGMSDLNGDGAADLVVGASQDDDGGSARGAAWVLFLESDGTVVGEQKISSLAGGFTGSLNNLDRFGTALTHAGDLNGDGIEDLAVGATFDAGGGVLRGSVWTVQLDGAVCGNATIEFAEDCDEGDTIPGDGCSHLCQAETIWPFVGSAVGGYSIYLTVDGEALVVVTTAGQSAADVAQAVADAINADPTLGMNGTYASVIGDELITNGVVSATQIDDPGLAAQPVPTLSEWAVLGLCATMLFAGVAAMSSTRETCSSQ
ncbi:MAG: cysteine-rich repeat protein [Myxococcota bacterium]